MEIRVHDGNVQNCSACANGTDDAEYSRNANGFESANESDCRRDKSDYYREWRQPPNLNAQGHVWGRSSRGCGVRVCRRHRVRRFEFFAEFSELRENVVAAHVLLAGDGNVNRQQWKKKQKKT